MAEPERPTDTTSEPDAHAAATAPTEAADAKRPSSHATRAAEPVAEAPAEEAPAEETKDAETQPVLAEPVPENKDVNVVATAKDPAPPETERMPEAPPKPASHAPSGRVRAASQPSSPAAPAHGAPKSSPAVAEASAPLAAYEAVARSAKLPDLVAITLDVVGAAAAARRADATSPSKVKNHVELARLARSDADTAFGNAFDVLERGPEGAAERALAQALWAHAVAEAPRSRAEEEDRLAADVLWLAAHTAYDATPLLDRALGEEAADLWKAIAERVKRIDEGRGAALGRAEAIVGCAALAGSAAPSAVEVRAWLGSHLRDALLVKVLGATEATAPAAAGELRLSAELAFAPRGPVVTTLLAVTGILFVLRAANVVGRLALAYRTPTEVSLSGAGVRVRTRTEMLGRTLRERELVIAKDALVRVVREVRYPRAAFYAGLLALVVGSYIGVRAFVDGVRAASPSLLLVGLLVVALGVAADFVLGSVLPGSRGRCRLAFVPKSGRTVWVGDVDARRADEVLARVLRGS